MEKEFQITWCKSDSEYPKTNTPCPKCNTGTIYTSKFGGVYCNQCKYKWKPSKFGVKEESNSNSAIAMLHTEIVSGYKEINVRLDKIVEYLVKNIPEKK